jgi:predicted molibdopterin-dependent oxidoreductase YjgC
MTSAAANSANALLSEPRFVRVGEENRKPIHLVIDGADVSALEGDTVMIAILTNKGRLRKSEFGGEARSGFCLMAACQDCLVWTAAGDRLRACDTPVSNGLSIVTQQPDISWPQRT